MEINKLKEENISKKDFEEIKKELKQVEKERDSLISAIKKPK